MNTFHKRMVLFLVGCIGTRSLLVYFAKQSSIQTLKYLGYTTLIPTVGFMYLYLSGTRQTGAEVFGDTIWWNDLRPIHAVLYGLFSYNAIMGNTQSWIYLLIDVVFGLLSFLVHHFI